MDPASVPRAVCVTRSATLKKMLRRTLSSVVARVEFADELDGDAQGAAILLIDRELRLATEPPQLARIAAAGGKIIIIGDSLEDADVVSLLRNQPMNHIISEEAAPDEGELIVTSVKLLSGDIFGLEKYLAWGAKVSELDIASYEEKRAALFAIAAAAKEGGSRRQVVAKIESVTDELLMNALYDAPAVREGVSQEARIAKSADTILPAGDRALLRYASDGRYFAVSVQDNYGELHKEAILDHLSRARAERGRPKTPDGLGGGAGLGLYFILSSVTRFIANISPGHRTEVVCLFDLRQSGREAEACARSLHIFHAPAAEAA